MINTDIIDIAPLGDEAQAALLALNNANARETSLLTPERWRWLAGLAFRAVCVDDEALLIALDQDAAYDSVNFAWFKARHERFVYIDRIVVSEALRGQGVARALYEHLFDAMTASGHDLVGCEVNRDPPNPGSDAFHARMGFEEAGRAVLADSGKTVRYLLRRC